MKKNIYGYFIRLSTALFLILFSTSSLSATELEGYMKCKVTDQTILRTTDGQASTYGYFQGEASKGDELIFTYHLNRFGLRMNLNDERRDQIVASMSAMRPELFKQTSSSDLLVGEQDNNAASFGQDYIRFSSALGKFFLSRYFKSDWEGLLIRNFVDPLTGVITTVNCRHQVDQISAIQALLR